jgi:hypothetical protein
MIKTVTLLFLLFTGFKLDAQQTVLALGGSARQASLCFSGKPKVD